MTDDAELIPVNKIRNLPLMRAANPPPQTIHRWLRAGVAGVRLEGIRIGARWYTTTAAVEKFLALLNNRTQMPAVRAPIAADVDAELDALGVK